MFKAPLFLQLLIASSLGFLPGVTQAAEFQLSLSSANTLPSYCQEEDNWCGAASAQMVLQGYPGGLKYIHTQQDIWNMIQANLQETNWSTDPDGLQRTLVNMGNQAKWEIIKNPSATTLMYSVISTIASQKYPTPVLVWGFQHWVVVDGFTANADPNRSDKLTLKEVELDNPWPPCENGQTAGVHSLVTGADWYKTYWYAVGSLGSKWDNNFVGVAENASPSVGEAIAEKPRPGASSSPTPPPATLDQVKAQAANTFVSLKSRTDKPAFDSLKTAQIGRPLLVKQEDGSGSGDYYLVPLESSQGGTAGAIIIDAQSGDFEEIGVFPRPRELTKQSTVEASFLSKLHLDKSEPLHSELVFRASHETKSRFLPVWRVQSAKSKGKQLLFDRSGSSFEKFTPIEQGD